METITAELKVTVKDGPKIAMPPIALKVDAYDKFTIPLGLGEEKKVDVQPGAEGVSFLLITSSLYTSESGAADKKLTFTPNGNPEIRLSAPQFYMGADAIAALLGNVKEITLKNTLEKPKDAPEKPPFVVEVSILVGRAAAKLVPPKPDANPTTPVS